MFRRTLFDLSKPIVFALFAYLALVAILVFAFPKDAG